MRVGIGFDVHPFADGRALVLGGVTIPSPKGLAGHSDADVLSHAVTDAVLGAAALGDLGEHFPDDDPRWKDASSIGLLRAVTAMLRERSLLLVNVDATILLESPRVGPHRDEMRANLAGALDVGAEAVSVKATTTEGLGLVGRGEGAACIAVALVDG
jgi:2-C-methyl-D-erythritol 2,4-cyclodiphosphate synthase